MGTGWWQAMWGVCQKLKQRTHAWSADEEESLGYRYAPERLMTQRDNGRMRESVHERGDIPAALVDLL